MTALTVGENTAENPADDQTLPQAGCLTHLVRPAWKPKFEVDHERHLAFQDLPVREALPDAAYRLAYLTDPDVQHARKMLAKVKPPLQTICDCCGWPRARAVGNGWAACEDCLPNASDQGAEGPYRA